METVSNRRARAMEVAREAVAHGNNPATDAQRDGAPVVVLQMSEADRVVSHLRDAFQQEPALDRAAVFRALKKLGADGDVVFTYNAARSALNPFAREIERATGRVDAEGRPNRSLGTIPPADPGY